MTYGLVATAAITAAGAIGSSIISSNATSDATKAQEQAAQAAQAQLQPYNSGGLNAFTALQGYTGVGPGGSFNPSAPGVAPFSATQFQQSPGYNFQLQQGLGAINNAATIGTGALSGNTLKALQGYATGLANQDYYSAADLYQTGQQNTLNALQQQAGIGENAAVGVGNIGLQGGNAKAAGAIAQGNIMSNLLRSLTGGTQSSPSTIQQIYSGMFGSGGSAGGGGGGYALSPAQLNPGGYGG